MNDVVSISKDRNEPAWLLKEREDALKYAKEFEIPEIGGPRINKSENVKVLNLEEMLKKDARFTKKAFLSRKILPAVSPHAAYLGAFFRHCSFMFVDRGKKAELDLSLGNSLSLNFFFIGSNASISITGAAVSNCMDICEIIAEDNSRVDCAFLKQKGAFAYRGLSARMGTGSIFCGLSFWSGSGYGDTSVLLQGAGSKAKDVELSIAGNLENLSLKSNYIHSANDTESKIIMKGVAQDKSSTVFDGTVTVEGNGRGAQSDLAQHVLLLDEGAKAEANPVMEIKNDDVECSHSASVRKLEEDKLFYMMSRGLPMEQARTTMVTGFLRGAINSIENKELRNLFKPSFLRE